MFADMSFLRFTAPLLSLAAVFLWYCEVLCTKIKKYVLIDRAYIEIGGLLENLAKRIRRSLSLTVRNRQGTLICLPIRKILVCDSMRCIHKQMVMKMRCKS